MTDSHFPAPFYCLNVVFSDWPPDVAVERRFERSKRSILFLNRLFQMIHSSVSAVPREKKHLRPTLHLVRPGPFPWQQTSPSDGDARLVAPANHGSRLPSASHDFVHVCVSRSGAVRTVGPWGGGASKPPTTTPKVLELQEGTGCVCSAVPRKASL